MIRRVKTEEDVLKLVPIVMEFARKSEELYGTEPVPVSLAEETLPKFLKSGFLILAAEEKGKIVGFVLGMAAPYIFNPRKKVAQEMAWFVSEPYRGGTYAIRLIEEFERWASEVGADVVSLSCIVAFKGDGVSTFYERRGYKEAERSFVKWRNTDARI